MTLEAVHRELDYERWEPELRRIDGVWNTLQRHRKGAGTPAGLKTYRAYLQRCIQNVSVNDAALAGAALEKASSELTSYWESQCSRLAERIWSRGFAKGALDAWAAKWEPQLSQELDFARSAWEGRKSKRHFDKLMAAQTALVKKFEDF